MLSGIGPAEHLRRPRHRAAARDLPGVGANLHDHVDVVQVLDAPKLTDLFGLSLAGIVNLVKGIFEWRKHPPRPAHDQLRRGRRLHQEPRRRGGGPTCSCTS